MYGIYANIWGIQYIDGKCYHIYHTWILWALQNVHRCPEKYQKSLSKSRELNHEALIFEGKSNGMFTVGGQELTPVRNWHKNLFCSGNYPFYPFLCQFQVIYKVNRIDFQRKLEH